MRLDRLAVVETMGDGRNAIVAVHVRSGARELADIPLSYFASEGGGFGAPTQDAPGISTVPGAEDSRRQVLDAQIFSEGISWGYVRADAAVGAWRWAQMEIDLLATFGQMAGAALIGERDRESRQSLLLQLAEKTEKDPLTQLMERPAFHDRVERLIADPGRVEGGFILHFLDLDHFKDINDTLGRSAGDAILQTVAGRLRSVLRSADVLARFGGDQFAVLQPITTKSQDYGRLSRKILEVMDAPFRVDGREFRIGVSIGLVVHQGQESDAERLMSHAEEALFEAKAGGRRTYRIFTPSMSLAGRDRLRLSSELRRALVTEEFQLFYQPQVEMRTGRITGVEALLRWRHPTRGLVSPLTFIPLAEADGVIVQIGEWVFREACRQTRLWFDAGIQPPEISINISAVQFRKVEELRRSMLRIIRESGVPSRFIKLEITETTLMQAVHAGADALQDLKHLGLKFSLDDFGTGYSSFDYLRRYPVDEIKIAQVFVAGILTNPSDSAIAQAAIGLAHELGLRVVAEGVEHAEQADLLAEWGCTEAQGYYFARPMSAEAIEPLLRVGHTVALRTKPSANRQPDAVAAGQVAGLSQG